MSSSSASSSANQIFTSTKNILSSTGNQFDRVLSVLKQNKYVYSLLMVVLIMYAPFAAPKISHHVEGILKNYFVKFIYIFVLTYLLTQNVAVATVTSIVITVGALILKKLQSENFINSNEIIRESEKCIEKTAPLTLKCTETSCGVATNVGKNASNYLCPKQASEQDKMSGYICNEMPNLEPTLNESDFPGYVQFHPQQNDYDPNTLISDVPTDGIAASNSYTVNNLGDEHESV
jgi:hypothetical protein